MMKYFLLGVIVAVGIFFAPKVQGADAETDDEYGEKIEWTKDDLNTSRVINDDTGKLLDGNLTSECLIVHLRTDKTANNETIRVPPYIQIAVSPAQTVSLTAKLYFMPAHNPFGELNDFERRLSVYINEMEDICPGMKRKKEGHVLILSCDLMKVNMVTIKAGETDGAILTCEVELFGKGYGEEIEWTTENLSASSDIGDDAGKLLDGKMDECVTVRSDNTEILNPNPYIQIPISPPQSVNLTAMLYVPEGIVQIASNIVSIYINEMEDECSGLTKKIESSTTLRLSCDLKTIEMVTIKVNADSVDICEIKLFGKAASTTTTPLPAITAPSSAGDAPTGKCVRRKKCVKSG